MNVRVLFIERNELLYSAHNIMQWVRAEKNTNGVSSKNTALIGIKTLATIQALHTKQEKVSLIGFHNSVSSHGAKNVPIFHTIACTLLNPKTGYAS